MVVTDRTDWWNLYRVDVDSGALGDVVTGDFDIVQPHWVFGGSRFAPDVHVIGDPRGDHAEDIALQLRTYHMMKPLREGVRRAHALGIPVATGTDGTYGDGDATARIRIAHEIEELVKCGLTPLEAITAATGNAARLGPILHERCNAIQARHPSVIGNVTCAGLVAGIQTVKAGQKAPDHDLAHRIIELCYQRGVLLFAPVGAWGQTVKICPPLTVTEEALLEACDVLDTAVDDAVAELAIARAA